MNRTAQCCCGQLSIDVKGEPETYGICHCNNCKKRTGSAFGISSYFNNENVLAKIGEAGCYSLQNLEQNHRQKRYFCKNCGTTLFWSVSSNPNVLGIAGGCFTDSPLGEPAYSASHANICAWLSIPDNWQKSE